MIAVIDYGVGNLFSLASSLNAVGADSVLTSDPEVIKKADKIILPGVGAFEDTRKKLTTSGLDTLILDEVKNGKKMLGICLGMQMLFDVSYEYGTHAGLSLIPGEVAPLLGYVSSEYKIPHIGWNKLSVKQNHPIFKYINDGDYVYFVHSYHAVCREEYLLASCDYDKEITAAVAFGNVVGTQFHPEKSGAVGLAILKAFVEW